MKKKILVVLFLSALSIQCAAFAEPDTKNLVILNERNKKYHKLDCEYGNKAKYTKLIRKPLLRYQPAECCYKKQKKIKKYPYKNLKLKNNVYLYFVNPKKNKTPKNECSSDNCKALLKTIQGARTSIDFALYGFNEQDDILSALIQAQNRGVKIRGIVDKDENNFYFDTKKLFHFFKDIKTDTKTSIAKKEQKDKFTRAKNALMHNKFFIIDNRYVWTGSTNLSSTCMTFNANIAILIDSYDIAQIYKKEFEQMYLSEKFHDKKSPINNNEHIKINNGKTDVSVYFSPTTMPLTNYVSPLIKNAKSTIHISMFYLTHKKIVEDLINAKSRGVDVKIILDGNFVADGYSPHQKLREAKIPVKIENWRGKMHMKNAIIDNNISIIGSTNWTSTAELVNDENMLIIVDSKIANKMEKNFKKLWNTIPDKWLYSTPEFKTKLKK